MTVQEHERGLMRLGQSDCLQGKKEIPKESSDLSYLHNIHRWHYSQCIKWSHDYSLAQTRLITMITLSQFAFLNCAIALCFTGKRYLCRQPYLQGKRLRKFGSVKKYRHLDLLFGTDLAIDMKTPSRSITGCVGRMISSIRSR